MCVNVYAELISSMTLYLMQNTEKGDKRIKDGLSAKLDIEPNKLMTRKQFMYNLVNVLMLEGDGNQITFPRYAPDGLLDNLEPIRPSAVRLSDNPTPYTVNVSGKVYQPDELLHFVINPDPEKPYFGTGYHVILADVVRGLRQAASTKRAILESPAPSIIVKVDGLSDDFASEAGRTELGKQYLTAQENGRPWFIPAEQFAVETVKPLTMKDLALADNVNLDKRTVAGIFGVPPFLVGVGDFNKDEFNNFISTRIMGMAQAIQQELTRKLIIAQDRYFRFNLNSLYAYSLSDIINAGKEMVDRVAMDRNEWRDWTGREYREDMEELIVLENYIPAKQIGDQSKLKPKGGE